jgi:glutathione peroxidase
VRRAILALLLLLAPPALAAEGAGAFAFVGRDGADLALARFAGQAVLVVNTDSMCELKPPYYDLQTLWERYRGRGLMVIAVTSTDFETASDAKRICALDPSLDYAVTRAERVVGAAAHPFYRWVAAAYGPTGVPRGDFAKVLLDPEGAIMAVWQAGTAFDSPELAGAIEAVLPR